MRFMLEVHLPDDADACAEIGRILRDLGAEMKDLDDLEPGDKQDIYDSSHNRVGSWAVIADSD